MRKHILNSENDFPSRLKYTTPTVTLLEEVNLFTFALKVGFFSSCKTWFSLNPINGRRMHELISETQFPCK